MNDLTVFVVINEKIIAIKKVFLLLSSGHYIFLRVNTETPPCLELRVRFSKSWYLIVLW